MSEPTLNYVTCPDADGGHRMAYWQWGSPESDHLLVCVHGLSRQGRDFDVLAQAVCEASGNTIRVVCPDVVGRGQSDWLKNPMGYQIPAYAADMLALLNELKPRTLDWFGTSMGGLIGLILAGSPDLAAAPGGAAREAASVGARLPVPIRRLVLNDVGPVMQWQALQRIGVYLGQAVQFDSLQQAADALWADSTTFGPHTPAQWLALSSHMVKPLPGAPGKLTLHYDPAIAVPFREVTAESVAQGQAMLWALYDNIKAETLLTRGAESDLLSPQTAQAMTQRGPRARLVEFAGVGHAPTFVVPAQVQAVLSFLLDRG